MTSPSARGRRISAVVFDLEFTAWEGSRERRWSLPGERTELVQIGAVKLDAATLKIQDEFEVLVRPRLNPDLSDYFTGLTGITNAALAHRGVDFVTAYRAFLDFTDGAKLWAFGRDDLIFAENIKLYGWERVLRVPPYENVIPWFAEYGIDLKGKNACDVAEAAGAVFEGRRHDALADAHGVARGMTTLIAGGARNPFLPAPS
jgi:inhibitor of KinA sporulation pathway (predicted exonuclease)